MDRPLRIALLGNPNTGKTTLFNALTGLRQQVGNYPGITVEIKSGDCKVGEDMLRIIDLPGTYSLAARSPDELIALDLLLGRLKGEPPPDAVLSIVDATNLERHLYLSSQLFDLQLPMVLAVNFIDEAERKGIRIDAAELARRLGVPVIPVQANRGVNLDQLKAALAKVAASKIEAHPLPSPDAFDDAVDALKNDCPDQPDILLRRLMIDVKGHLETRLVADRPALRSKLDELRSGLAAGGYELPQADVRRRYDQIRSMLQGIVHTPADPKPQFRDKLDHLLTHRLWGTLIFVAVMFGIFQAIFTGAMPLMELIDTARGWLAKQVEDSMTPGPLRGLLADGIVKGVGSVLVFLPQILILFACIGILEDCGYLARAAFLMDRLMSRCGLNGRSFIPLLSSVACAVPGIMSTRVIENHRDRLATILVAPLMSCSARLPLYILIIGTFLTDPWWLPGVTLFAVYMLGFVTAPLLALLLKRTLLRGPKPLFVMEMPPLRRPTFRNVFRRMFDAGKAFVMRAGTLILAAMVLVWASLYFPNRDPNGETYESRLEPLTEQIEKLEGELKDAPDERKQEQLDGLNDQRNQIQVDWKANSILGKFGRSIEPVFRPLGWDWKIGVAALASFPAREVVVGTLGILYGQGEVDSKAIKDDAKPGETPLGKAIHRDWSGGTRGKYVIPVAVSLIVFFAYCCQCVSTLAVIRRETKSWKWPVFTFVYMTALAYLAAMLAFQVGKLIVDARA